MDSDQNKFKIPALEQRLSALNDLFTLNLWMEIRQKKGTWRIPDITELRVKVNELLLTPGDNVKTVFCLFSVFQRRSWGNLKRSPTWTHWNRSWRRSAADASSWSRRSMKPWNPGSSWEKKTWFKTDRAACFCSFMSGLIVFVCCILQSWRLTFTDT